MAQTLLGTITNIAQQWNGEKKGDVEKFIKYKLEELEKSKMGTFHLERDDDGKTTVYAFASESDRNLWLGNRNQYATLVISQIEFYASSSSGGEDYSIVVNIDKHFDNVMAKGQDNIVRFEYQSYYGADVDDIDTLPGYAKFIINQVEIRELELVLRASTNPSERIHEVNIGKYLTNQNNDVELIIGNQHGKKRSWKYQIQAIELRLSLDGSYDESELRESNWELRVNCSGAKAIVNVAVDGENVESAEITNSTNSFRIDRRNALEYGPHKIVITASAKEYEGINSNVIETSFIKGNTSMNSVCIGGSATKEVELYGTASIPYFFLTTLGANKSIDVELQVRTLDDIPLVESFHQTVVTKELGASGMQEWRFAANLDIYLSQGIIKLVVIVEGSSAVHYLRIINSGIELKPADECVVLLSAKGKTNQDLDAEVWQSKYENQVTCTVVRSNNFHLSGDNGFGKDADGEDKYLIKNNKYIILDGIKPFDTNFGAGGTGHGRTFEFEFASKNCINTSAKIIECFDSGTGFIIYADHVELWCDGSCDKAIYPDEKRIRIGFVIEGYTRDCVNTVIGDGGKPVTTTSKRNLAYIYINGVIVCIMSYGDGSVISSWKQQTPQNIKIGSDLAQIDLYTVRIYDKALNYQQMIDNYAYDTPRLDDKIAIAKRNDVLDSFGEVEITKVRNALPYTPHCIWEMERMPIGKKDYVNTNTEFINPYWNQKEYGSTMAPFTCTNGQQALDGTSSLTYPDPYKNFASKYSSSNSNSDFSWVLDLGNGEKLNITKYSITKGLAEGEKEFVHKVNFASSEGIGNILAMNSYNNILLKTARTNSQVLTPQQRSQDNIVYRQSLSGFPEIGWIRTWDDGVPHTRFLSLFNFINNKYSPSIFGLTNDGTNEVWEVNDNNNFFQERLSNGTWNSALESDPDANPWICKATDLYYARIPKKSPITDLDYGTASNSLQVELANSELQKLLRFHNWIYDCNPNIAERYYKERGYYEPLGRTVTYNNVPYSVDSPAYRKAKFISEYQNYINKDNAIFYFIFVNYFLGIDSFDKNMSIAFLGENNIAHIFLRDTDSICMFDNQGILTFKWWHEWNDAFNKNTEVTSQIDGEKLDGRGNWVPNIDDGFIPVYNGRLSGLWDLVAQCWQSDIKSMYSTMRSSGLNYSEIMKLYNEYWNLWSESLYNVDGMGYANTGRFSMAHGDKKEAFTTFFKYRERYMDSKYGLTVNLLQFRVTGGGANIALRYACPLYASMNWGAGDIKTSRQIVAGEPSYFEKSANSYTNTTVVVYNADLLTEISTYTKRGTNYEESGMQQLGDVQFAEGAEFCKRLKKLILDYSGRAANATIGERESAPLLQIMATSVCLEEVIIRNCPGFVGACVINSEVIKHIDLRGTSVTSITLPEHCDVESIYLPETVTRIKINDAPNLTNIYIDGNNNLLELTITGSNQLGTNLQTIVSQLYAKNANCTIKLNNINFNNVTTEFLIWMVDNDAEYTGTISMIRNNDGRISLDQKIYIASKWGNIDEERPNGIKIDYQSEPISFPYINVFPYISQTGSYPLSVSSGDAEGLGNNVLINEDGTPAITYSIEVNQFAGVQGNNLIVNSTDIESVGRFFTITANVTNVSGRTIVATGKVAFYKKTPVVGDFAYANGNFGAIYNKDYVVGIVFMAIPDMDRNETIIGYDVRVLGLNDVIIGTGSEKSPIRSTFYWGVYQNNDADSVPSSTISEVLSSPGITVSSLNAVTGSMNSGGLTNLGSDASAIVDNGQPDGWKNNLTASDLQFDGKVYTNNVVLLAKQIVQYYMPANLADHEFNSYPMLADALEGHLPENDRQLSQIMKEWSLRNNASSPSKYEQLFYPVFYATHMYQPTVKVELHDSYKQGKWYVPAKGEIERIYRLYKISSTTNAGSMTELEVEALCSNKEAYRPIFAISAKRGCPRIILNAMYWTSSEYNATLAWYMSFSDGYMHNGYNTRKCNSYRGLAVAAFEFKF